MKIENRKRNENSIFSSERENKESFLLEIFRDRDSCQWLYHGPLDGFFWGHTVKLIIELWYVGFTRKKEFIFFLTETLCSILLSRLQYSRQGSQINWVYFRVSETSIQFLVPIPFRLFLPGNTIEIEGRVGQLKTSTFR